MSDVLVKYNVFLRVAKNPTAPGAPIQQDDFAIDPSENNAIANYDVDSAARFQVPAQSGETPGTLELTFDSVVTGSMVAIRVEAPCGIQFINGLGTSPIFQLVPGVHSVLWMELTGITLTNVGAAVCKGRFCVVGEPD